MSVRSEHVPLVGLGQVVGASLVVPTVNVAACACTANPSSTTDESAATTANRRLMLGASRSSAATAASPTRFKFGPFSLVVPKSWRRHLSPRLLQHLILSDDALTQPFGKRKRVRESYF